MFRDVANNCSFPEPIVYPGSPPDYVGTPVDMSPRKRHILSILTTLVRIVYYTLELVDSQVEPDLCHRCGPLY